MHERLDRGALEVTMRRSWPALTEVACGALVARFADGFTRRANSAWHIGPGAAAPGDIEAAEAAYRLRGQPAIFRMTSLEGDGPLDASLAARGYSREGETLVLWRPLGLAFAGPELDTPPLESWLADFALCRPDRDRRHELTHAAILLRRDEPRVYGRLQHNGAQAVGTASLVGGIMDIDDVGVEPRRRGSGAGRAIIEALLGWGIGAGARHAILGVEEENTVARRLYESLGFVEAYRYWYRRAA